LVTEYEYQVKFVIDTPADLDDVARYLQQISPITRDRVLLMPQGTDQKQLDSRAAWLRPYCESAGFMYCPRKQFEWFGPVRGT
jgi:7-carboxy-7-deazaguanine synthase